MTAPLPITLRQLQYLLALAETRNFRRAAEQCAVVQPALSAQIAALEQGLGVCLFERKRRGAILTPAGEAILARARRVLVESGELVQEAQRFQNPLAGVLRVGIIPTLAPYLLPEVAPLLAKAHPALQVHWVEERTPVLVGLLQEARLDAAIMALEAELEDLETAELGRDPFFATLPKGHPKAKGRSPMSMEDLEGERLLLLEDGHCLRDQALAACAKAKLEEQAYRATSLPTLVQMVASGQGITLLPRLALATETARAPVAIRPLADPMAFRTLVLTWRRGSYLREALQQLAGSLEGSGRMEHTSGP